MDIGEQERVIIVEPLQVPTVEPAERGPVREPEPSEPATEPEPVPA